MLEEMVDYWAIQKRTHHIQHLQEQCDHQGGEREKRRGGGGGGEGREKGREVKGEGEEEGEEEEEEEMGYVHTLP